MGAKAWTTYSRPADILPDAQIQEILSLLEARKPFTTGDESMDDIIISMMSLMGVDETDICINYPLVTSKNSHAVFLNTNFEHLLHPEVAGIVLKRSGLGTVYDSLLIFAEDEEHPENVITLGISILGLAVGMVNDAVAQAKVNAATVRYDMTTDEKKLDAYQRLFLPTVERYFYYKRLLSLVSQLLIRYSHTNNNGAQMNIASALSILTTLSTIKTDGLKKGKNLGVGVQKLRRSVLDQVLSCNYTEANRLLSLYTTKFIES